MTGGNQTSFARCEVNIKTQEKRRRRKKGAKLMQVPLKRSYLSQLPFFLLFNLHSCHASRNLQCEKEKKERVTLASAMYQLIVLSGNTFVQNKTSEHEIQGTKIGRNNLSLEVLNSLTFVSILPPPR